MNVERTRWLLMILTGLLVLASVAVAWWGARAPSSLEVRALNAAVQQTTTSSTQSGDVLELADFQQVWNTPLQGARPAPTPVDQPPPERPRSEDVLQITLKGLFLERGRSKAILVGSSGELNIKGIGEVLDIVPAGVRVEEIRPASVKLSHRGRTLVLQLPSDEAL